MVPSTSYSLATSTLYCNYCPGYCCYRRPGSSLYLDHDDINRIARFFKLSDGEIRKLYIEGNNTFRTHDDGSCVFLSPGKMRARCSIHTVRPRQCQEFPYAKSCPYLDREDLLSTIQPLVEASIIGK